MAAPEDDTAPPAPPRPVAYDGRAGEAPAAARVLDLGRRARWNGRLPRGRGDLRPAPFPLAAPEDWRDPARALAVLYEHAEAMAIEVIDWYLADKRYKKLCSRLLRALAIVLVAAGGVQPLVSAARSAGSGVGWGYVLLALAAACVGFDRFFGLSSGWMRDITAAQAVQRRLERLQFDWAAACARVTLAPLDADQVGERLDLLRAFSQDVGDLVRGETGEWVVEFQSALAQLDLPSADGGGERRGG